MSLAIARRSDANRTRYGFFETSPHSLPNASVETILHLLCQQFRHQKCFRVGVLIRFGMPGNQ